MLQIHKGDDTNFLGSEFLTLNITSSFEMSEWTCDVTLCGLTKTFTNLTSPITLNYSNEDTSKFIYGMHPLTIKIIDSDNRIKTVSNSIQVFITKEVVNEENDTININVLPNSSSTIDIGVGGGGGSGTNDHSKLINLDYTNSGHIGFASAENITNLQNQIDTKQPIGEYVSKSDLNEFVKNTDYATETTGGAIKIQSNAGTGIGLRESGIVYINQATNSEINAKSSSYKPITPQKIDYAVKVGITTNSITLTDTEKTKAQTWLGIPPIPSTDGEYKLVVSGGVASWVQI